MSRPIRSAVCAVALGLLAACATEPVTEAAQADGPALPRRVKKPSVSSSEYRRSWGLQVVNAYPAYQAGATGRGVVVGLIDVGLEGAQPEVLANASPLSTDLMSMRDRALTPSRHGGYVAGTLASSLNGGGVIGVAYDATVLSIRADVDGRCDRARCVLKVSDLARGIDYALDNGAKVIALALQGDRKMTGSFEDALARVRDAGAVVVIAAGNGASEDPSWPARYAADPRFAGSVIAVGAVNVRRQMTRWSNRAGLARQSYLVAPGQNIITDCDTRYCSMVSGTSFAVPYVAGAIALVLQASPGISGREAAALVLSSAQDLGAKGADPVYGQGLVDIGRAVRRARTKAAS